jgi:hypothetical protein
VGVMAAVILLASAAHAPRLYAATVYSSSLYTGQNYTLDSREAAATRYNSRYPGGATIGPTTGTILTVPSYDRIRFKVVSLDTSCSHMISNSQIFVRPSKDVSAPLAEPDSCTTSGSYITFALGYSTTTIYSIAFAPENGTDSDIVLDGSGLNAGKSVSSSGTSLVTGGIAFDLCMTTCDGTYEFNPDIGETGTRFISTTPQNGSTTGATTFPIGTTFYVAEEDFDDDLVVFITMNSTTGWYCANTAVAFEAITCHQSGGADPTIKTFTATIPSHSTVLGFSTTTSQRVGLADVTYTIKNPYFFGLLSSTIISTSTRFTVSTTTAIDDIIINARQGIASTTEAYFDNCNPLSSWDLRQCLAGMVVYLFTPTKAEIEGMVLSLHNDVLTRFPIGYVTRFMAIVSSSTALMPPPIAYTFGSSSPPALQGLSYSLQPYDHLGYVEEIRSDTGSNDNVWDIIQPMVDVMVALSVAWVILNDLLKLGTQHVSERSKSKVATNTQKE